MASGYQHYFGVALATGMYAILAAGIVIGGCGWAITWMVGQAERRVRGEAADERRKILDRLTELTSAMEQLSSRGGARPGPASPCRAGGHTYASQASQPAPAGIRQTSVDAATGPSGVRLQRAREDGIEQGFEIGYRAQLAERGVTPLPRPRRPRLTGDS
ncbi:hypothetical protein [Micromonospora sp. NPDC050200]|uniref:hypothetical protein n=1 Tax=Micromonospora sp. NPDC050200 TaxID=3155664 RepID=UPI00340339F4